MGECKMKIGQLAQPDIEEALKASNERLFEEKIGRIVKDTIMSLFREITFRESPSIGANISWEEWNNLRLQNEMYQNKLAKAEEQLAKQA
jgi:hypothetical protein